MSLLEKRPGELFALLFILGGIALTLGVSAGEKLSGMAGRSFDGGLIDGSGNWHAEVE